MHESCSDTGINLYFLVIVAKASLVQKHIYSEKENNAFVHLRLALKNNEGVGSGTRYPRGQAVKILML